MESLVVNIIFTIFMLILAIWDYLSYGRQKHRDFKSIIMSTGVLGTFVGIFLGLQNFNVNEIENSVPSLLSGLKIAFYTSILGMGLAILLSILQKSKAVKSDFENMLDYFSLQMGKLDKLESLEKLQEIAQYSKEEASNQRDYHVQQLENFKILETSFNKTNETLKEAMHHLAKGASKELIAALQEVIRDFNVRITDQFGDNFKELNNAVTQMITWQNNYRESIAGLDVSLKNTLGILESTKDSLGLISSRNAEVLEVYNALAHSIEASRIENEKLSQLLSGFEEMHKNAQIALQSVESLNKNLADTHTQSLAYTKESLQEVQNFLTQSTQEHQNNVKNVLENAQKESLLLIENQAKHSDDMLMRYAQNIESTLQNTHSNLTELSAKTQENLTKNSDALEQHITNAVLNLDSLLGNTTKTLEATLKDSKDTFIALNKEIESSMLTTTKSLDALLNDTAQTLSQSTQNIEESLTDTSTTLSETFKQTTTSIAENLSQSVQNIKENLEQKTQDICENLTQTSQEIGTSVVELLEKNQSHSADLHNLLEQNIESFTKTLESLHKTSQEHTAEIQGQMRSSFGESYKNALESLSAFLKNTTHTYQNKLQDFTKLSTDNLASQLNAHTNEILNHYKTLDIQIKTTLNEMAKNYLHLLEVITKQSLETPKNVSTELLNTFNTLQKNLGEALTQTYHSLESNRKEIDAILKITQTNIATSLNQTSNLNENLCKSLGELDNALSNITLGFRQDYEWFLRRIRELMGARS